MAKAAAQVGRAAHLPEQPVHSFGACCWIRWDQSTKLIGEIQHDGCALEQAHRLVTGTVHHGGDFRIWVDLNKARAELITFADVHKVGVIFCTFKTHRQQFFQHHSDFDAVWCGQRMQLQRVLANGQFFFTGCASYGAVDVGELSTVAFFPLPDGRGCVC